MTDAPTVHICIHPAVPTTDSQKVQDLVVFAQKFLREFAQEGETATVTMPPWSNDKDNFALALDIRTPMGQFAPDALHRRRKDMETFAEKHYPHFSRSYIVTDPDRTPSSHPKQAHS